MRMSIICGYYVTDIRFSLLKKYKDVQHSGECHLVKERLDDKLSRMSEEKKASYLEGCMKECLKMYRHGKATHNNSMMHRAVVVCFAIIDSI